MEQLIKKPKAALAVAAISVLALGVAGFPLAAHAMTGMNNSQTGSMHKYVAEIRPLNNTGVSGTAVFTQQGRELTAKVDATGLEPGVHPQHIHGKQQAEAECPTNSNDTNGDGFVSVIEGAPSYGLIKMNLTSPQTAFGKPPTPVLFDSFAGTPDNKNFPVAAADGTLHFTQTYHFDDSAAAQAALKSLTPLGDQAFVLHGATAPLGVDASAFAALGAPRPPGYNPAERKYDPLLPAGCGPIEEASTAPGNDTMNSQLTGQLDTAQSQLRQALSQAAQGLGQSGNSQADVAVFISQSDKLLAEFEARTATAADKYHTSMTAKMHSDEARNQLINSLAAAKDSEMGGLNAARNQLIDQLNRQGVQDGRDAFINSFDAAMSKYGNLLEQAKNQL